MQKGNKTQSPAVKPGEENNVSNTETKKILNSERNRFQNGIETIIHLALLMKRRMLILN